MEVETLRVGLSGGLSVKHDALVIGLQGPVQGADP